MAKTKEQKEAIIERVRRSISAPSTVFVHFNGLPVTDESAARGRMKDEGISYFVAKKTLINRALTEGSVSGDVPVLDGEVAIAHNTEGNDDPTATARFVHILSKEFGRERFSILGGVFEGRFLGKEEMEEIATIPSILVLRGMFVNIINSPIQGLAVALGQIAEQKA